MESNTSVVRISGGVGGLLGFLMFLCICLRCCRRRKAVHITPVVVTTTEYEQARPGGGAHIVNQVPHIAAAHTMAHPGGDNIVQHTHYHAAAPYPLAPMHYHQSGGGGEGAVPYPMPQPQQQQQQPQPHPGYPVGGAVVGQLPYPAMPVPRPLDNPPLYDQVAGSDAYQKQQPYNPNFQ